MSGGDAVALVTAIGAIVLGVWKGIPAVIVAVGKAIRDRDKEIQKIKDDAAALVEVEREAAHQRRKEDLADAMRQLKETREELEMTRDAEQDCQLELVRHEAWLVHVELALTQNDVKFVPFAKPKRQRVKPNAE